MTRRPSAATAPRGHVVPRGHVAPRRLPRAGVRVIERAVDLLLCFDEANERLTLQELSDRAGIHKATAFRILATLVADRILDQPAPGGPYELGFFALGRADAILGASVLRGRAVPIMLQLRDELDETVIFAERHGDRIVNLDKVASRQGVIAAPVVGIAEPLHESPAGLAVLASFDAGALDRYLKAACDTPARIRAVRERVARLRALLADPAKAGARDPVVAVPILDEAGTAVAALSIAIPAGRVAPKLVGRCLTRLLWAARQLRG